MKNSLFLIALTFFCTFTFFSPNTFAEDYTTRGLPEGAKIRLGKGSIGDIAYSPDGTRLAVASSIGIWIYDAATGEALELFTGHTDSVYSVSFSPVEEALRQGVPEIHHSDQGVQYLSKAYVTTLEAHGVEISVVQRGRPWENGYAERLIRTLKEEEVHLNDYDTITEARERIGHFIEQVYHQKRPHSALEYLTPAEFERKNLD